MSRLHRTLLGLLPRGRRARDGDEILRVFAEQRASASRQERLALWWNELVGLVRFGTRERATPIVNWLSDPVGGSMKANWKWLIAVPTVAGAIVGFVAARTIPPQYRAEALVTTVAPRVAASYIPVPVITPEERASAIQYGLFNEILSRSRLERIINDLDLYRAERASMSMEDVVGRFREAVGLTTGLSGMRGSSWIKVSYVGSDPKMVTRVTNKLAALFIDESTRDRKLMVEGTDQFLESQIKDVRQRLVAQEKAIDVARRSNDRAETEVLLLENEALRARYKELLAGSEASRSAANIERREIGEQFRLLDAAETPSRIGPTRLVVTSWGAVAGLGLGLLIVLARVLWRVYRFEAATAR